MKPVSHRSYRTFIYTLRMSHGRIGTLARQKVARVPREKTSPMLHSCAHLALFFPWSCCCCCCCPSRISSAAPFTLIDRTCARDPLFFSSFFFLFSLLLLHLAIYCRARAHEIERHFYRPRQSNFNRPNASMRPSNSLEIIIVRRCIFFHAHRGE